MSAHKFRAIWPITDETMSVYDLAAEAAPDLPRLAAQAKAKVTSGIHWSIRPGSAVPGSGGHHRVLVAEAAAVPLIRPAKESHGAGRGAAA